MLLLNMLLLSLLFLSNGLPIRQNVTLPIVLMHGIASNKDNMNELKDYLIDNFNLDVIVPEIGNGIMNSINIPLSVQGELLCTQLKNNPSLSNGFNFIGISQGGILGRYYIEKCNGYQVNNFITMVSPHGGVYKKRIGSIIDMYGEYAQSHYSFSSYWRDPYDYTTYTDITLLANLNNEIITCNSTNNMINLNSIKNFVMVYSPNDSILSPPESGIFSTYDINSLNVISMKDTSYYISLGLKDLNENNKIYTYKSNCTHDQHKNYECFIQLHDMFKKFCT